jgi:hypothetical protein
MKRDGASGRFNFTRWSVDDGLHIIHSSAWTASSHDEIEAVFRIVFPYLRIRPTLPIPYVLSHTGSVDHMRS